MLPADILLHISVSTEIIKYGCHLTIYRLKRTSFLIRTVSLSESLADTVSYERLKETRTGLIIHQHKTMYRLRRLLHESGMKEHRLLLHPKRCRRCKRCTLVKRTYNDISVIRNVYLANSFFFYIAFNFHHVTIPRCFVWSMNVSSKTHTKMYSFFPIAVSSKKPLMLCVIC